MVTQLRLLTLLSLLILIHSQAFAATRLADDSTVVGFINFLSADQGISAERRGITGVISVDIVTAGSNADSSTAQSDSGLEFVGTKITLIRGCADNELLKWDETDDDWNCESNSTQWQTTSNVIHPLVTSDSVGISTIDATSKLTVSADSTAVGDIFEVVSEDSSTVFIVSKNNRVGINVEAPNSDLHIDGGSNQGTMYLTGSSVGGIIYLVEASTVDPNDSAGFRLTYDGTTNLFHIIARNAGTTDTWVTVARTTGHMGISELAPDARLEIAASADATTALHIKGNSSSQSASLFIMTDSSDANFFDSGDGLASSTTVWNEQGLDIDYRWESSGVDPALFLQGSDGFLGIGLTSPTFMIDANRGDQNIGTFRLAGHANAIAAPTGYTQGATNKGFEVYTFRDSSNNNYVDLVAAEQSGFQTSLFRFFTLGTGDNATEKLRITPTGLVGVNVTDPDAMLEIETNATTEEGIHIKASASQTGDLFHATDENDVDLVVIQSDGDLFVQNNSAVGTTDITSKMIVSADTTSITDIFEVVSQDSSTVFIVDRNKEVGINTADAVSTLHAISPDGTTIYLHASTAGKGAQILLEDTDGLGCTKITALNGVLTAATTACF